MAELHAPSSRCSIRRYDPESGEAAYWEELHDRARAATARCSTGSCRPRTARRLDRHPLLLPRRDLRLLRRAHQRQARPGLPHAPRQGAERRRRDGVIDGRADGQHARDQGPDRRHGRGPLEEDPARHAVADPQASRSPSASTSSRTSRWSTSRSRWPASSAAPACRTACRWRSTRCSSARPRWPRPTASSATRATPSSTSACKDLAEDPHGIYDCTHCFNCIEACPKGVAPMSQIMRLRRRRRRRPRDRRPQQRPPPRGGVRQRSSSDNGLLHEAELLPRSYGGNRGSASSTRARRRSCSTRCRSITKALLRAQGHADGRAAAHKLAKATSRRSSGSSRRSRARRALRAQPLHHRLRRGRPEPTTPADDQPPPSREERRAHEGRLLARLREPRLHPRAARLDGQGRAAARHRARRARPRLLLRRRRDRRAQPGARRHAQRAHVRARPAGRGRRADDEHLLDLPGRAERVPGAPRRERRVPRARQRDARRPRA